MYLYVDVEIRQFWTVRGGFRGLGTTLELVLFVHMMCSHNVFW